jgi:hypothetical protein
MPETCPPVCGCRMTSQNSSRRAEKLSKEDREQLPNVSIQHSSPSLSLIRNARVRAIERMRECKLEKMRECSVHFSVITSLYPPSFLC